MLLAVQNRPRATNLGACATEWGGTVQVPFLVPVAHIQLMNLSATAGRCQCDRSRTPTAHRGKVFLGLVQHGICGPRRALALSSDPAVSGLDDDKDDPVCVGKAQEVVKSKVSAGSKIDGGGQEDYIQAKVSYGSFFVVHGGDGGRVYIRVSFVSKGVAMWV
ncbi:hypothetical protein B0H16DRAFT_1470237 [Mycena metata]|uniref:Uncharacterized protein n=1 Tax=Mycena metata TaxID=1033252 RepID=A0AAD7MSS5_9AGAR|nr:hypothetical protein B0H16DRAFT_1470237 [Mycena metata]